MRALLLAVALLAATPAWPGEPITSNEALIDQLVDVGAQTPGMDDTAMFDGFIATDAQPQFREGLLGYAPPPPAPPAMRELVRRGVAALPALLAHLDDARPTRLIVGAMDMQAIADGKTAGPDDVVFMAKLYNREYDPRGRASRKPCDATCELNVPNFWGPYTVKVGDVCFGLIGQIVNRWLFPVRYQPTLMLMVNSPVQTPELARETRADWTAVTVEQHRQSLLADIKDASDFHDASPALIRLRFYYPSTYAALLGEDAVKRTEFEADEKKP
jgi:hypothetical protein